MTMYVSKRFPSLVEAVVRQQYEDRLRKMGVELPPEKKEKLPALPGVPAVAIVKVDKKPPKTLGRSNRQIHARRFRDTTLREVRPGKPKPPEKRCLGCQRRVPWELHLATCPTLER